MCIRVARRLSQTTSTQRKAVIKKLGEESRNQAVVPIFVGYALVLLLLAWGILSRRLSYLRRIYSEGVTRSKTRQLQGAYSITCLYCFWILHLKNPPLCSENKLVFRLSNRQKHVILSRQNDGLNPKLFHLFYLFQHSHTCSWYIKLSTGRQNCNNFFRPKKMNSSLYLFIFEWKTWNFSSQDSI